MASSQHPHAPLPVGESPVPVPTFGCVVYVLNSPTSVVARSANLVGLESTGSSEREALSRLVPKIKELIRSRLSEEKPLDWIDPPLEIAPGEVRRFLPIHL